MGEPVKKIKWNYNGDDRYSRLRLRVRVPLELEPLFSLDPYSTLKAPLEYPWRPELNNFWRGHSSRRGASAPDLQAICWPAYYNQSKV